MTQLTPPPNEAYAVIVPKEGKDFKIMKPNYGPEYNYRNTPFYLFANGIFNTPIVKEFLDEYYDWEILGTVTSESIDFDVSGFVSGFRMDEGMVKDTKPYNLWHNYTNKFSSDIKIAFCKSEHDSFRSLLKSKEVEIGENEKLVIIQKR